MEENKCDIREENLKKVAGGSSVTMPCPKCGKTISVSTDKLASGGSMTCSGCGFSISIDVNASTDPLQYKRKIVPTKHL